MMAQFTDTSYASPGLNVLTKSYANYASQVHEYFMQNIHILHEICMNLWSIIREYR